MAQRVLPDPLLSASPTLRPPPVRAGVMLHDSHLLQRLAGTQQLASRMASWLQLWYWDQSLGARIKPGSQCASDKRDMNSWGLEQHQLWCETQMGLGFGSVNAEICRCFFKPETNCCEWRDVASVSSQLQKKM